MGLLADMARAIVEDCLYYEDETENMSYGYRCIFCGNFQVRRKNFNHRDTCITHRAQVALTETEDG